MKLNLGAADRHCEGFTCIDIAPPECAACGPTRDRTVDLGRAWPWADSSVEEVLASDVCEHVGDVSVRMNQDGTHWFGNRDTVHFSASSGGRIWFMNELHRVLVPGGRATIETPNAAKGVGFWQDPTHVSPWCLSTFRYFEAGAFAHQRLSKTYGITAAFKVLSLSESQSNGENPAETVFKIKAVMEAVKP